MKSFFKKIFAPRSTPATSTPASRPVFVDVDQLRQAVLTATAEAGRLRREEVLGEALGRSGQMPSQSDSEAVWVASICHVADKTLAQEWLEIIQAEAALARIALEARSAETRQAAAKRITDIEQLRILAERSRDKDRGVYKHCSSLIKIHEQNLKRAADVAALKAELKALRQLQPLPPKQLYDLRKRLTTFEDGDDLAECRAMLAEETQREQDEARAIKQIEASLTEARALRETLKRISADDTDGLANLQQQTRRIESVLESCPEWLITHADVTELRNLLEPVTLALASLDHDARCADRCRHFLAEHEGSEITDAVFEQWAQLPKPEHARLRAELDANWKNLTQAPEPPTTIEPSPPTPKRAPSTPRQPLDSAAFKKLLEDFEQAIENGELQAAGQAANQLDQLLGEGKPPHSLMERYRKNQAQLGRLRDWARWSGGRVRDELIEAAEALLTLEPDVAYLTEEVPKLRAEWRHLDAQALPTSAQRRRFDAALTQAFQPVLAHRAEQNALAETVRQAKTELLQEAEEWLQTLDWEQTPINSVQAHRQTLRNRWRALGHTRGRTERALNTKFDALMNQIEAHVAPALEAETARRNGLIQAALRLQSVTEIGDAINQARTLQQRWREETIPVQLPRKKSDDQWHQFRQGIDAVFARREALRTDQATQLQQQHEARLAMLTAFQGALEKDAGMSQLETDLAEFRTQWSESLGEPKKGGRRDELENQAAALMRDAEHKLKTLRAAKQHELFATLTAKSALAAQLEFAVAGHALTDDQAEEIRRSWAALPPLPGEIERKLGSRLESATAATEDQLEAGLATRGNLLLDLEILMDLPSPSVPSNIRQDRQLELLQQGFRDRKTPSSMLDEVTTWYATAAMEDAHQAARIEVVNAKLATLLLDEQGTAQRADETK